MLTAKLSREDEPVAVNRIYDSTKPRGTLTRQDIALAIFDRCEGLSRREAKRLVDSVIEEMVETLVQGETLKLHDFGSFVVREKRERAGRNPRTGERVPIEPRMVVVFKASPNMKAVVNGDGVERRRKNAADPSAKTKRKTGGKANGKADKASLAHANGKAIPLIKAAGM
jgi:integration host factor subunit alpha